MLVSQATGAPNPALSPQVSLRPYQLEAVERLRAEIRAGQRKILLIAPTGSGKTVIASHMIVSALARGKRVLFVAHRREILSQTYQKLLDFGVPRESLSIVMGNDPRYRPAAPVQIASIQTLNNREKPPADLIFFDEAHRAISQSYLLLAAYYPSAVNIGLTATPWRADGKAMREIYTSLVVVATVAELIASQFLVEPQTWTVPADQLPDLSRVRKSGNDYSEQDLAAAVNHKQLVGDIVEHWLKHAGSKRTFCFAVDVKHSRSIVEQFLARGIPAEHVDANTPACIRAATLERLRAGTTLVVSNVGVFCEGTDVPQVKCAILARPTLSLALHLQQPGRIMRPWQEQSAVILDHAGNCAKHGLPQDDREYSLDPRRKRLSAPPASVKTCSSCYAMYSGSSCPACGEAPLRAEAKPIETVAGQLVEAKTVSTADRKARFEYLCQLAANRGYRPGFVLYSYKSEFGQLPPSQWSARKRVAQLHEEVNR
jgi:DNA repair protein RadD